MEEQTFTVAGLSERAGAAIRSAFAGDVWVKGEIRDLSRPASGHVYFSLVDGPEDGDSSAMLPVTLFAADRRTVNRLLLRSGAVRMVDGVEVRIRGTVTLYPPRSTVQLRMTLIDPDYTVGRLAADRELLLRRLDAAGLLAQNRRVPLLPVPLRVGLVTSVGSAAHADFLHELGASGLAWKVLQVDTRVQGSDAAVAIGRSVEHLGSRVDVIAVVRGGGAATDLAVFDDERVARAIAGAPVQIFTGIGHEIDTTVADAVAARSLKTPTACGAALVSRVTDAVAALDRRGTAIGTAARSRVGLDRVRIAGHSRRLAALSTGVLRARIAKLDRAMSDTRVLGMRALRSAAAALATREARVTAHDPAFLFARGWSVTTTKTGEPLKSVTSVETGSDIVTRLADGFVDSSVDKVRSDREGGAQ